MKRSNGFAHMQLLLILLIIAIIGAVGFFVYNARDKANDSLESAANATNDPTKTEPAKTTTAAVPEEDSWLLFTPEDKAYSVRVPDGWSGVSLNGNLYVRETAKLVYAKGTKAVVEMLSEGGWDGAGPFQLYNPGSYADQIVREGTESGTVKTNAGLTAKKYIYVQATEPEGIGYPNGAKVYNYYFDADGKYIQVSHVVFPGAADESAMVERAIKTLTVN